MSPVECLVSIIMPTFNVETYVDEAINSLLRQTYKNLEIIIVDDCSTDNTFNILKKYEKLDKRVKILKNQVNSKITVSLNNALEVAHGKYIARMDGDDISLPDRIEKQVNFLEKHREIDLVGGQCIKINSRGEVLGSINKPTKQVLVDKTIKLASPALHPTWLVRRRTYEMIGGYHTVSPAQDYDFLLRMHSKGMKISNIEHKVLKLRVEREGNTSSTSELTRRKAVNYMLKCYKERLKTGEDLHSDVRLQKVLRSGVLHKNVYKHSQKIFEFGTKRLQNNKIAGFFIILYSALLSPYQMQFIIRWFALKVVLKTSDG